MQVTVLRLVGWAQPEHYYLVAQSYFLFFVAANCCDDVDLPSTYAIKFSVQVLGP